MPLSAWLREASEVRRRPAMACQKDAPAFPLCCDQTERRKPRFLPWDEEERRMPSDAPVPCRWRWLAVQGASKRGVGNGHSSTPAHVLSS